MEPSGLNDQMTICWKAGVYEKSWLKKNQNVVLKVDVDEVIEFINDQLENDMLTPDKFGEMIHGVANILHFQLKHFSDTIKHLGETKKKEKPFKKTDAEPQLLDLDAPMKEPENNLDFFVEKIAQGDQNLLQEDLPLPNIIEAEIDKGFGEMNLDDLTAPELEPFADLLTRLNKASSSRAVSRPPQDKEETVAIPKSAKKSVTFAEPPSEEAFQVPEEQPEIPAASEENLELPATPEVSKKTRLEISNIRPESTEMTPVSGFRTDITKSVQTVQVSPQKKSSRKEQVVSAENVLEQSSVPVSSPQKELTVSTRGRVHEVAAKPTIVPKKKIVPAVRYNKRRFELVDMSILPTREDGLPARCEKTDENDLDYFFAKWNDIGKAKGNIKIADDDDFDERIAEIYPKARRSREKAAPAKKSLPRDAVEPEIDVQEETVHGETEFAPPIADEPMPADVPIPEAPTGAEFEPTGSQDDLQPSNYDEFVPPVMQADEQTAAAPTDVYPIVEQPTDKQPVDELPAEEQPVAFGPLGAKQQKIIQNQAETAELLEKIKNELIGRDSVVFQDIYPERNEERNLAFYRLLYLANDRKLKVQQDGYKGPIIITLP